MEKFFYDELDNKVYFGERDYWEDSHMSDGTTTSVCVDCGKEFVGYKGRLICKVCKNNYPEGN